MSSDKSSNSKKEQLAKRQLFDSLFDDFYSNRARVYRMNFFRGLCFGFGSLVGGTVVVAILVWALSLLVDWPFIGEIIKGIIETVQS